jgi:phosphoserine phosphatase RsbU/P
MKKLPLFVLPVVLGSCGLLWCQRFDLTSDRVPIASLDGLWRFHTGDSPAWADVDFDDSKWQLLRSDKDWSSQGYAGYSGMAWYRFQVIIPADAEKLSIYLPEIKTCYEVYADGKLIGTYGKMGPTRFPYRGGGAFRIYSLSDTSHKQQRIAIALRVWHWPGWASFIGGGPQHGGGLIGESEAIEHRNGLDRAYDLLSQADGGIIGSLCLLAAAGGLALFLLRRKERVYLWFGLSLLFSGTAILLIASSISFVWNVALRVLAIQTSWTVSDFAYLAFLQTLLQPRHNGVLKLAAVSVALRELFYIVQIASGSVPGAWSSADLLPSLFDLILNVAIITVVLVAAYRNSVDARLLAMPVVLQTASNLLTGAGGTSYALGWQHKFDGTLLLTRVPFPIDFTDVAGVLLPLSILGILIFRFARTRSQEDRFEGEVQAAQKVQQYLIPEQTPPIVGFAIESVYRPAREVGGDFFQVFPNSQDGSVLIVVGDVAGKGMHAGMLASLIVGAIRTAVAFTPDPARIMVLLNERLQQRGLVTCLALRIDRGGNATLVNAGHLPPFLNGNEMLMEGALPLGAIAGIEFPVSHFQLAEGDSLMLMSDGVAEAQDDDGRLFGFERIAMMLHQHTTAAGLANAAQVFGQEDDITVLTIERMAQAANV